MTIVYFCESLAVVVEDSSSSCCVTVKVFPHTTIDLLLEYCSLNSLNNVYTFFLSLNLNSVLYKMYLAIK